MSIKSKYFTIVIGGGHAGAEAAAASARMGVSTLLITKKLSNLGEMSCNPSIGGIAKGTIVKEIDALDGVMGRVIDMAGIHYRILNASKGAAVQSPRAQADRSLYRKAMREVLEEQENLDILEDSVEDLIIENDSVKGVILSSGEKISTNSIVITTGTFLNGVIHVGDKQTPAGRRGEEPSVGLSEALKKIGFNMGRLKTGTPARLDKDSIDYSDLEAQTGDEVPQPFSYLNDEVTLPQVDCHITYTNAETHKIIRDNLKRSALYGGHIVGKGPRYCPSIEDKIVRFSEKERHQVFLEPEGLDSNVIYPSGLPTSLPEDAQYDFIHSMKGLENVNILQYGYAIEYDFVDARELYPTLETKKIKGLFLAGQINGTTGYEEAGGQGLVSGINAALIAKNSDKKFILGRADGYIGVMIDDLITLGITEPYRMFTSRAEYRLLLRADNADLRLTPRAIEIGCASEKRKNIFTKKLNDLQNARELMQKLTITPSQLKVSYNIQIRQDGIVRSAFQLLGLDNIQWENLAEIWGELRVIDQKIRTQLEIEAKYSSYLKRQELDINILKKDEEIRIPDDFDYSQVKSLSNEVREKLSKAKPLTIGQASRIPEITPAAIMAVLVYLKIMKKH